MTGDDNALRSERIRKARQLKNKGVETYASSFKRTCEIGDLLKEAENYAGVSVACCGRIMGQRFSWKFIDLADRTGSIQLIVDQSALESQNSGDLKLLDRGDFLGVTGKLGYSRTGQLSLFVHSWQLLSKSLRPLPDEWSDQTAAEKRYRQRYLDFLLSEKARQTMVKRSQLVSQLRMFLAGQGFLEFETPVFHTDASGAEARPFSTHHNALDADIYLRIATEMHLKRLIIGGFEKVFEIGKVFRNEGISTKHNPEFTMIELYQAYGDYNDMMDFTEKMLIHLVNSACGKPEVEFQGKTLSFAGPFKRVTMHDAIKEYTGLDLTSSMPVNSLVDIARALEVPLQGTETSAGEIIYAIFSDRVEPHLIQPTFVTDYPVEVSWVQARHPENPELAARFELFVNGTELVNGCTELCDPQEQRQRFERQASLGEAGNDEMRPVDNDFIIAMEYGMPPTMGIGMGIDRLVMFLTDSACIRDTIAFPLQKKLPAQVKSLPCESVLEKEAI